MSLVNEVYAKEDFEELKKDPVFREAFLVTQEYFRSKPGAVSLEEATAEPKYKKLAEKKEGRGKYFTAKYWKGVALEEKLNTLSFRKLLVASTTVPLAFDIAYLFGGAKYGTAGFSDGMSEVAQTPVEALGFLLGVYVGKGISAPIKAVTKRYDKKLTRLEVDVKSNADLVKALGEELVTTEVVVPAAKPKAADVPFSAEEPSVDAAPKSAPVDRATQFSQENESLVERMKRISGVGQ
jgi:hypothetical protein